MTARPTPTVTATNGGGGPRPLDGGAHSRAIVEDERAAGRWVVNTGRDWKPGGSREDAQTFDADERPAPAIDGKGRWHVETANFTAIARDADGDRSASGSIPYTRPVDDPAPTVTGGASSWKLRADAPAATLAFGHNAPPWVGERPATTVAGDPRVHPPGHKLNADDERAGRDGYEGRAGVNAVRVEQEEALVLQSFPPDYPVQGTKTKRFEQIGNAVPPLLARACLQAVGADAGVQDEQEAAA